MTLCAILKLSTWINLIAAEMDDGALAPGLNLLPFNLDNFVFVFMPNNPSSFRSMTPRIFGHVSCPRPSIGSRVVRLSGLPDVRRWGHAAGRIFQDDGLLIRRRFGFPASPKLALGCSRKTTLIWP